MNLLDSFNNSKTPGYFFRVMKGILWRLFFLLILIWLIFFVYQKIYADRIYPGVYLGEFNLGGLRPTEARNLFESFVDQIEKEGLGFVGSSEKGRKEIYVRPVLVAVSDPDLSRRIYNIDLDKTVNQAMAVGRKKFFLQSLKEILIAQWKGWPIESHFQLNSDDLLETLKDRFKDLEKEPKNANFQLDRSGKINFVAQESGYYFDFELAVNEAKQNLANISLEVIELKLININPDINLEDIKFLSDDIEILLSKTPIYLKYNQKRWKIDKFTLSKWIEFAKNDSGISFIFNKDKIAAYLRMIARQIEIEPLDAKFKLVNGRVVEFQPSRNGLKLDIEENYQIISKQILDGKQEIELALKIVKPRVLTEDVNDLGIKELIGRGVSNFAGSPKNRRHNIAVGAKKLNGILIKPGEEFSLVKAIGEVSKRTGYLPELVIKGNRTIPEYGGGLCQIGTTTFRVALYSGLPITARTPHTYRVIYYEPAGMDATIYSPQPDFKFINDTGHYILFQTKIEGNELIFEFYGTSDGRRVEISQPKIFNLTSPGPPLYIKTDELKPGEKKRIEKAVVGADTEFSRVITWPDGREKREIWKSHYRPWQEVWLVGMTEEEKQKKLESSETINE